METRRNTEYMTNAEWLSTELRGEKVIVALDSALEMLGLFSGFFWEKEISVYATKTGHFSNVNYIIVNDLSKFDTVEIMGTLCTSASQTFNDIMKVYDTFDDGILLEALNDYYFSHGESFSGLQIDPGNKEIFDQIKKDAIEYTDYC